MVHVIPLFTVIHLISNKAQRQKHEKKPFDTMTFSLVYVTLSSFNFHPGKDTLYEARQTIVSTGWTADTPLYRIPL